MERLMNEVKDSVKAVIAPEFLPKETRPLIGAYSPYNNIKCSYDLVEEMDYIFVHVVKATNLPTKDAPAGSCCTNTYVEVKVGQCKASTNSVENEINPVWDQVFAFSKDQVKALCLEIIIKDKIPISGGAAAAVTGISREDNFIGQITFDANEIPRCNRQNKLAAQWYKLAGKAGEQVGLKGELLLAVWEGTQADKAFLTAWHSDAAPVLAGEYMVPKLWYVKLHVIEAQDLVLPRDKIKAPELRVVAVLGNQTSSTRISSFKSPNPMWNEELLFVATEPFKEELILTVEEVGGLGRYELLGRCSIPLQYVDRKIDHRFVDSRWYSLTRLGKVNEAYARQPKFSSRIHTRISLEGGYHLFYEANTDNSSDIRPAAKQLWMPPIGVMELGILSGHELLPMKTNDGIERTDAYCVATYGKKWSRTRTITNSFNPKWNEQCTWEVFDLFTVVTIGVFDDDNHFYGHRWANGSRMGKVKIRVSSLESGRVYRHRYPLLVLSGSGVKKMGEIELAVRYTCTSWFNTIAQYSQPLLPAMHYLRPLTLMQLNRLRDVAIEIIVNKLDKAEPPLRREVVDYLLEVDSKVWSPRRSKANFLRVTGILRQVDQVCNWKRPIETMITYALLTVFWLYPQLIPTTIFLSLALICIKNYKLRWSWQPPKMDSALSLGEVDDPDELDEEFDTFPSSQPIEIVKKRYERLRCIGGRIQTELEEWASFTERLQCLVTWGDRRVTALFLPLCIVAVVVSYYAQLKVILIVGFYLLRPPWLRRLFKVPLGPINIISRLPSMSDQML